MAIHYKYRVYEDYPKATAISESRERGFACLTVLFSLGAIASVICLFADFSEMWPMIFVLIFFVLSLVYLCTYYQEVTERKIRKAIEEKDKLMEEIRNPSYACQSIKFVSSRNPGMCNMCLRKNVELAICEIKYRKGSNLMPICKDCISKFESNSVL